MVKFNPFLLPQRSCAMRTCFFFRRVLLHVQFQFTCRSFEDFTRALIAIGERHHLSRWDEHMFHICVVTSVDNFVVKVTLGRKYRKWAIHENKKLRSIPECVVKFNPFCINVPKCVARGYPCREVEDKIENNLFAEEEKAKRLSVHSGSEHAGIFCTLEGGSRYSPRPGRGKNQRSSGTRCAGIMRRDRWSRFK